MPKLLHVVGSPRPNSHSTAVAKAFLDEVNRQHSGVEVETLELWKASLPEFDGDKANAKMTVIAQGVLAGNEATAWAEVKSIIDRFVAADAYLFTVPMWNGGIPYKLKQYIDILTQPGELFGLDPKSGYFALQPNKPTAVIYTAGVYTPGVPPAFGADFHSTYFDWWLDQIGIKGHEVIRFQPTLTTADRDGDLHLAQMSAREAAGRLTKQLDNP